MAEPDEAIDRRIILHYYEDQEPDFATDEKVDKVFKSFKKKARKAGGEADWREMMYAAFTEQRGVDPRDFYHQTAAAPAPVPPLPPAVVRLSPAKSPHPPTGPPPVPAAASTGSLRTDSPTVLLMPESQTPVIPTPGSRLAFLEEVAVSPQSVLTPVPAAPERPADYDEELEEEMAGIREEYLMDLFTNCQTCLDPISGEKLLVADLSYTIRMLSVEERYNLRSENELSNDIEDNLLFERRSATTLAERAVVGTADAQGLFSRGDDDDVSKDGSSILLTEKEKFKCCVLLGAPACGKTTLLQKMRYWAALKAYEDADEDLPVFVAVASFAAFVDSRLCAGHNDDDHLDLMAYLEATCSAENYRMLEHYHKKHQLLLLCDGLDESAHVKDLVQRYLAADLTKDAARVIVSSRLAGFSDEHLSDHGFQFVQLELCTAEVQKLTAKRRMGESDFVRFCDLLEDQPMLSAYATTPLTLSLLIQLFKNNQLATNDELESWGMVMNRGALYEAGVLHMLDMTERRAQRIEAGSTEKYPQLDVTMNGEVWLFLEKLALDLHMRGTRDFMISDVRRLGGHDLWQRLEPYLLNYMIPLLMRLEVDLTTASIRRTSMTEPAAQVAEARFAKNEYDDIRFKWRFIHLTFQEFFTARRLLSVLRTETKRKGFLTSSKAAYKNQLDDKLYDAWYREALLLLASSANDGIFSDMIDYLLSDPDASGVKEHLVTVMLEERREHPKYAEKKKAVWKAQESRLFSSVIAAMSHPYPFLRRQAAQQLRSLDMSIGNIAKQMADRLKDRKGHWFSVVAMMESLIDIRVTYELEGGEEAGIVGDGKNDTALAKVICATLLVHDDLDVVRAAARGLGAIGVTTNPVMFGLLDKLDNGHRYVLEDVSVALLRLGMGWHEITQQIVMRTNRPTMRASTCVIDDGDDTPNAEWLAAAEALGKVLPSEEAKIAAIPELERVLNHVDVEVSVAGAQSLSRLGGGAVVIEFCVEWLQRNQPLKDRLSAMKALRAMGTVQLEMTELHDQELESITTPRTRDQLWNERPKVLSMLVELLADPEKAIRAAAVSALLSLRRVGDDAWETAVTNINSISLEAADAAEQLVEMAASLSVINPAGANKELLAKLLEVMQQAEWRLSKAAAGSLVTFAPGDPGLHAALLKWLHGGFEIQTLEAVQLLGKTRTKDPAVRLALLELLHHAEEYSALAVGCVQALGDLGIADESLVAKLIEIILAGDEETEEAKVALAIPLKTAALNTIAQLDEPPHQLSGLVNKVLLNTAGL